MNRLWIKAFLFIFAGTVLANEQPNRIALKPLSATYKINMEEQSNLIFPILAGKSLTVTVMAGENFGWKLRLPDGTWIDKQNATNYGVEFNSVNPTTPYEKVWVFPTAAQFITLPNPVYGNYELQLDDSQATTTTKIIPVAISTIGSNLRTGFDSKLDITLGEKVSFAVFLFEDTIPITNATVQGKILDSNRVEIATFNFIDDGQNYDHLAGDGLYTAIYEFQQSGGYLVSVKIKGTTSTGKPFEATEIGRLIVNTPDISLTGTYQDYGIDTDNDGYFDYIRFIFDTQGPRGTGTYYLRITLKTPDDSEWIVESGRNSDPNEPIAVNILAEEIKKLGIDGPYKISKVVLDHDYVTLSHLDNLGDSSAYTLDSLERRNTLLYPVTSDRGVDIDGDGLFDRLEVVFGVDVLISGYYGLSSDLDDQQKNELGSSYIKRIYLKRGFHNLEFTFSGEIIGQSGQEGPYVLNNVLAYPHFKSEASTAILAEKLGTTKHYTCSQFAGCQTDPNALLERLISQFAIIATNNNLNKGIENSLMVKLLGAKRTLEKGNKNANKTASRKIHAFINEVRTQNGNNGRDTIPNKPKNNGIKAITDVDADMLVDAAIALLNMIDIYQQKSNKMMKEIYKSLK